MTLSDKAVCEQLLVDIGDLRDRTVYNLVLKIFMGQCNFTQLRWVVLLPMNCETTLSGMSIVDSNTGSHFIVCGLLLERDQALLYDSFGVTNQIPSILGLPKLVWRVQIPNILNL